MSERDYAPEELEKARIALADASQLRTGGGSTTAVINRLYYACFHAAKAVLYAKGFDPTTHAGVNSQFGEHVVLPGAADPSAGRLLSDLQDHREQLDYGYDTPSIDAEQLHDRVEIFVNEMASLVDSELD